MLVQYQIMPETLFRQKVVMIYPTLINLSTWTKTRNKSEVRRPQEHQTGIPKILHQIWNDEAIPEVFQENIRGLVAHNKPPIWKYFFWTIKRGTRFIRNEFPSLLKRYLNADSLLKADILRLAVVYHFGGVYFDLDTVSVKPLDPFVESNNCSFVTDPEENVFEINKPKPILLITNSALFCQPGNWFIAELIDRLSNQSSSCKNAIKCTGPTFISNHYEFTQTTKRSKNLPPIVDYRYFEDKPGPYKAQVVNGACVKEPFVNVRYEWAKKICRNWIRRGGLQRNISELAYTYHTWFHTNTKPKEVEKGTKRSISEIVPNLTLY